MQVASRGESVQAGLGEQAGPPEPAGFSSPAPSGPAEHGAGRSRTAPWLLFLGLLGFHLALTWGTRVPIIHADELGYLSTAHYLGQGGDLLAHNYYPGYSFLLTPLFWLTSDILLVYRGAIVLNAALVASVAPLVWVLLSRLLPGLPTAVRTGAVVVAALYPPLILYANTAMTEALLITGFLLVTLGVSAMVARPTFGRAAGTGLALAAVVLVHPRMLPVVAAFVLVGLLAFRPWRTFALPLTGLVLSTGVGLAVQRALAAGFSGQARAAPEATAARLAEAHADPAMVVGLASTLGGQLFYLSVVTLGLFPLGLFAALGGLRRSVRRKVFDRGDHVLAFLALSFGGMWLLSAAFTNPGARVDYALYGRYNDAVLLPLVALGVSIAVRPSRFGLAPWKARIVTPVVAGGAILGSGALFLAGRSPEELTGSVNHFNVAGLYPLIAGTDTVPVVLVAGCGLVVALAVTLLARGWPRWSLVAAASVFLLVGAEVWHGYLQQGHASAADQHVLVRTVDRVEEATGTSHACLGYDWSNLSRWHYDNYRTFLLDREVRGFRSAAGEMPCSDLFISTGRDGIGDVVPGARRIALENHADQALWVRPGRTADRLEERGWLFGDDLHALPGEAYRAEIRLEIPGSARFRAEEPLRVTARVRHTGHGAPWGSSKAPALEDRPINLGARWYVGDDLLREERAPLPRTVMPGEEVAFDVQLRPPQAAVGKEATLVVDLVHERVRWFSEPGEEPIRLRGTVTR